MRTGEAIKWSKGIIGPQKHNAIFHLAQTMKKLVTSCSKRLLHHRPKQQHPTKVFHCSLCGERQFRTYGIVKPGAQSAIQRVPDHIKRPPYTTSNRFIMSPIIQPSEAEIKTKQQIQGMRDTCSLAREILMKAGEYAKPGVTTDDIDRLVHEKCIRKEAYPSPLLYKGYPKSVCTSVNNVACHGIPDDRPLRDGDIINIDVTVYYNGYHGDTSETFAIGNVEPKGHQLIDATRQCRDEAIRQCGPGVPLNIIGNTISKLAGKLGYQVIPNFCGHGIGEYFHGPPDIFHFANDDETPMLEGMTFTIEPILCEGSPFIKILSDGWTAVTLDGSRSAQCEHTILVTDHGTEILTILSKK